MNNLHRLVFVSDTVGVTGQSVLSIAQILGVAERNNRRDEITGVMLFHGARVLQAVEGARADLDRLMRRLEGDTRHTGLRVLSDTPIERREFQTPMALCGLSETTVQTRLAGRSLTELGPIEATGLLASCVVAPAHAA